MNLKAMGKLAPLLLLVCTACGPAVTTSALPTFAPPDAAMPPTDPTATPAILPSSTPEDPLAALANGQPIYLADYERKLGQYEASLPAQGIDPDSPDGQAKLAWARAYVLNVMIEQVLTEPAAAEAGITISDADVDACMQDIIAENGGEEQFRVKLAERGETYEDAWQEVRAEMIGMALTQRIIEGVPTTAEHVHARHILLDTPEEAERILGQLRAGADFASLTRAYSQDSNTREIGGDLDWFPRGILMVPEVEEAVFALPPGQFSEIVASSMGYHIVQVIERDPARSVSQKNLLFLQDRALQEWVEGLWARATVQRFVETAP